MLKVAWAAFTVACQTSLSAQVAFKWLHIPLACRQLAEFTTRLADEFGLGFSCFVRCEGENGTNQCHLTNVAFASHFVATYPPPTLPLLLVLATPVKNYLKWWEIS